MSRKTTSDFLKECMADALLTLMEKRPLASITVQEITTLADVGRATYYRHFASKEEVLDFKLGRLVKAWIDMTNSEGTLSFPQRAKGFFDFILVNQRIVTAIYNAKRAYVLHDYISEIMQSDQSANRLEAYQNVFFASGLYGITTMWIHGGFRESAEDMSDLVTREYEKMHVDL